VLDHFLVSSLCETQKIVLLVGEGEGEGSHFKVKHHKIRGC